jgi:uncharacterized protein YndB with AHSA1/START domain
MQSDTGLFSIPHIQERRAPLLRLEKQAAAGFHSLSLEVSIQADIRRLFHALTVPEYLEAWLSFPGELPGFSTLAARVDDRFTIDHYRAGRPSITISGNYRACRRRNVLFSWRVDGDIGVPETEVEIRLRGDFENTILSLQHKGFTSRYDHSWHAILWSSSIRKLAALYGSRDRAA